MDELANVWRRYRVPILVGAASVFSIVLSITMLLKAVQTADPITFSSDAASATGSMRGTEVVVDVAGAVVRPGVYRLPAGSRGEDAISAAGGLSEEVDADRLARSVNRAAKLSDGAKLYIPTKRDPTFSSAPESSRFTSINAASASDLEALDGIGPATAKKIIEGRPYASLEELVSKKAMGQALFEKLKDQLTL